MFLLDDLIVIAAVTLVGKALTSSNTGSSGSGSGDSSSDSGSGSSDYSSSGGGYESPPDNSRDFNPSEAAGDAFRSVFGDDNIQSSD